MKLLNKVDFPPLSQPLLYIKEELKLAFANYSLSYAWRKKNTKNRIMLELLIFLISIIQQERQRKIREKEIE